MAGVVSSPLKTHKIFFLTQISLRILSFAASLAAAWMMLTNKQNALVYGIWVSASYSYSSAFKFFAYANIIACAFSVVSLFLASIFGYTEINPTNYFAMFVHDLIITVLLMAGCAAATAIGFVGKYGVSEAGWLPLCDHFPPFCNRGAAATTLSYFSVVFYMVLTIISAKKSRQIQV
ncbi:CASP-like protein 1F1 [Primulina huaijiensis]|uniref:CASP-like protein 1F1 n=1 Tax=Primulina huaijiensis TaxID=1492673 RepID=UPI003CC711CD